MYDSRLKNSVENVEWASPQEPIDTAAYYALSTALKQAGRDPEKIFNALDRYADEALAEENAAQRQGAFVKFELNDGGRGKAGIHAIEFSMRRNGNRLDPTMMIEESRGDLSPGRAWILREPELAVELSQILQAWIAEQAKFHSRQNQHAAAFARACGAKV